MSKKTEKNNYFGGRSDWARCFVASAVYGESSMEVGVLREFRDEVLMNNRLGRKMVDLYYSGLGEKVADFVEERVPFVIPVIKRGLDCIVKRMN